MSDPNDPTTQKSSAGWTPTTSTVGGGVIGAALGQVIIAVCDQYLHTPLNPELASAITTLCVTAAGYFIKDGGRK
jgi:hypothetical protein